jgi:hypothetical protein
MSQVGSGLSRPDLWPALPLNEWADTYSTLHMWTQMVGKVRMQLSPPQNHWWHVPLYVSARGLTTSSIPCALGLLEFEFDFVDHRLVLRTSGGSGRQLALRPRSVADFYGELMQILRDLGVTVHINPRPQEVPNPVPFDQDTVHASYDPEYANRFWRVLLSCYPVFQEFRGRFAGKSSPVHFFWGSFDLAVTRFSGRRAPERKGVISREAYSHECSSVGWWPGAGGVVSGAAFYAYHVPEPEGYSRQKIRPAAAYYHPQLREFILMYDDVRTARNPEKVLMDFLQSSYEVGAELAGWERPALERAVSGVAPAA